MAISIRAISAANVTIGRTVPCKGPHTVVLEPADLAPGRRIYCALCCEHVGTMEAEDLKEKQ